MECRSTTCEPPKGLEPMHPSRKRTLVGLGAALAIGAGAGAGGYSALDGSSGSSSNALTTTVVTASPVATSAGSDQSVNQIWTDAGPGVVDITVTSQGSTDNRFPFPSGGGAQQAEGSGFVYDKTGVIVTNQHVVADATTVKVKFQSGKTYTAKVLGTDPSTDLA